MSGGRIVLAVLGALVVLIALGLLAAGGFLLWADQTQRDKDGFFTSPTELFETDANALVSDGFDITSSDASHEDVPDFLLSEGRLGTVRVRATPTRPGRVRVRRDRPRGRCPRLPRRRRLRHRRGLSTSTRSGSTTGVSPGPGAGSARYQGFWAASASGSGRQAIEWPIEKGTWAIVVMNADGSAGVSVDLDLGAKVSFVLWLAIGLLVAGGLLLLAGRADDGVRAARPRTAGGGRTGRRGERPPAVGDEGWRGAVPGRGRGNDGRRRSTASSPSSSGS